MQTLGKLLQHKACAVWTIVALQQQAWNALVVLASTLGHHE
jgi:hypothetical protein